jgi:hypothetical protein
MGVYKRSKKSGKENLPLVDEDALKAAAVIRLIETYVREKPRLTVAECMRHAGLPGSITSNRNVQQRVRRLVKKLEFESVIAAIDESLRSMHGIRRIPLNSQGEAFLESALKAAVLIHLIDTSARAKPLLSAYDCMIHAGMTPMVAEVPESQQLVRRLVGLLNLDDVLAHIDNKLHGNRALFTAPDSVQELAIIR